MFVIPENIQKKIVEQAEAEYPHECCGMVFGPAAEPEKLTRLRPCKNVYDQYHSQDPDNFPRSAKTAYFIDPRELLAIDKELREQQEAIRIIYHSHMDTGAYFSEEDGRVALVDGKEPAYPGVEYLVLSVLKGKVSDQNLFRWDASSGQFLKST